VILKKFRSAVTDSGSEVRRGEGKEGIANLIDILAAVKGTTPDVIEAEFADSRYGDFKTAVAEAVIDRVAPLQARYTELRADEAALEAAFTKGAQKAQAIASATLADVREAMGVGPRS